MSSTTPSHRRAAHAPIGHLGFAGVIRSEWIKLYTLRSTFWVLISILVLIAGPAGLGSLFTDVAMMNGLPPGADRIEMVVRTVIGGNDLAQVLAAILGVLVIGGEFSVGMIRSTFSAVPRRIPVLAAKAIVVFAAVFVVALIGFTGSWLVGGQIMVARGLEVDVPLSAILGSSLGLSTALGLVAVFGLGLAAVVRSSIGGICIVLGLLLVGPIILALLIQLSNLDFLMTVGYILIGRAGSDAGHVAGAHFAPWQNLLIVMAWTVTALVAAAILLRRRDA
jgi:ABC-2 type transport system permease protein